MKIVRRMAACTMLMLVGTSAYASSPLTPQQCNDYPFAPLRGAVTHAQLMNELSELESVGYNPADSDNDSYPRDLQRAEARLQAKYRADCGTASSLSTAQTGADAATH